MKIFSNINKFKLSFIDSFLHIRYVKSKRLLNSNSFQYVKNVVNISRSSFSNKDEQNKTNINKDNLLYTNKNINNKEVVDSNNNSILFRLPKKYHPFIKLGRYDKPVGWALLFIPCLIGLNSGYLALDIHYLKYSSLFLLGSIIMRSCGCAINDLFDKDLDKKVERSMVRPIASGEISRSQAIKFIGLHFLMGLGVLLQFNIDCIITGFMVTPIFIIYPLMKRFFNYPQLVLGICFNSGILIGYKALINNSIIEVLPLYLAGILWTLVYDTIYAHMDIKDDVKVGIKSSAISFKGKTKEILRIFIFVMFLLTTYFLIQRRNRKQAKIDCYTHILNLTLFSYLLYLLYKTNLNCEKSCLIFFKKNTIFGLLFALIILYDNHSIRNSK